MQFGLSTKNLPNHIRGSTKIIALVYIAIYAAVYIWEPFSEPWNTILTNMFLVIAASFAAMLATLIWDRYEPGDLPRGIWLRFAVGLWLWSIAELVWGFLNIAQGEVPEGVADVFWVAAYVFFAAALLQQYRILARPSESELLRLVFFIILALFALYIPLYYYYVSSAGADGWFAPVVNSFYPVADLLLAVIAIWLVRHFGGGAFSRPWMGLLAFSFTDLLYAWMEISGIYSWSVDQANLWSTLFDVAYLGAYIILGLGILSQWVFLKYGMRPAHPESEPVPEPEQ